MKQKETLSNTQLTDLLSIEEIGNEHIATSINTPLRSDAFERSNGEKIELIQEKFQEIMEILGLDLTDDSLKGTPLRVAKMYVEEIFSGLDPENRPETKLFENKFQYKELLVEKDISFYSNCEHHFVPFFGKAHVAYMPNKKVVGLSKINRIVQYYARRPQVQERLTMQIAEDLKEALGTEDIAVVVDSSHLCVSSRGVKDTHSSTVTGHYSGRLQEEEYKREFLAYIKK
ncbi:MAG: GTP cyclohydrolase I FolE [Cytophagales bacterium]|nr:GTP cyclohydrolase I FolE [Cytophagales bacterium]